MSCSRTLSGIKMECKPQKGGILEAYVAPWAANLFQYTVDSGSTAGDEEIPNIVTGVTSGTTWQKLAFRKNISNFTSTGNVDDANGVSYVSTEINLVFNKMQTTSRIAISALAMSGVAAVVKDANQTYWAFGLDEPVMTTAYGGESGTAATDANRYTVTLTDTSLYLPIEVEKSVGDAIAAEFDD